ncbi:hypothetical protein CTAYLR_002385 [Chrysophaeum taylorii]|uniref:Uncharacterized protein n=1 Tax=Chrysophaeum taylorii TaxID=2483200 RepID=A0AAD7UGI0_9STRA|nr:hypothetical protein CTAYLR_002385 [Chrysophaeum taylorii]
MFWRRLASRVPLVSAATVTVGGGGLGVCWLEEWRPPKFDPKKFPAPSYAGEVAIVTGGSTGIGKATCKRLAEAGATVYNLDIAQPKEPTRATWLSVDVRDVSAMRKAVDGIAAKHGRVDVLVSNAGIWAGGKLENVTESEYDMVLSINVKGAFFAIQSVLPVMRRRKSGSIILIGSDQSLVGKPEQNLYGMTKGALAQLAKSCAAEYASEGIRVNVVCPGTIDTPLMHGAVALFSAKRNVNKDDLYEWLQTAQPFPRVGQPEEVAALIAAIAKIPFVVGASVAIDGGYTCQ